MCVFTGGSKIAAVTQAVKSVAQLRPEQPREAYPTSHSGKQDEYLAQHENCVIDPAVVYDPTHRAAEERIPVEIRLKNASR
jgi:ABC-type arginine transport system ATPase subunit